MVAFDSKTQLANIAVVADETARMTKAFRGWPESYWQRPTYCPDWRAADAESLILLSMGRSDVEAKKQGGALTLTGNTQKAQRLCETLFQTF